MVRKVKQDLDYLILEILRGNQRYFSGQDLAHRLKISRQALSKHISKFIKKGYKISAVPHLGYRFILAPDKLYPWEIKHKLNTKFIGRDIYYYEIVDSTQDIAWQLGLNDSPEGSVVVAETQKKGRGRQERKWFSPRGGIYLSLILRPNFIPINEISKLTLLAGLACVYAIRKTTGLLCSLKWPNDILLGDKKLGGILCELNAETDRINFVVIGIGINVNTTNLPKEGTSLFIQTKKRFFRVHIVKKLLEEIESLYSLLRREGFSFICREWQKYSYIWGKKVKIKMLNRDLEGQAIGIDRRGYLLLKKDNGFIERVSSGDLIKLRY
jgi:BirA family biotin operon repressor/biotin-[acetyl-CoA-carboxylase] ligase